MSKNLDLKVVLAAREKITGPLKKVNATTTGTARALKQAQAETKKLQSAQRDISSFKRLDGALSKNSQALNESQERVRRLGRELQGTTQPTAKLRAEYNRARKDVEKFTQKGQEQRKELGKVRKRLSEAGVNARDLSAEEKRLADQIQATNTRIQRQKKYLDQLGKADVSGKFNNMTSEVGRFGRRTALVGAGAAAGIFGIANSTATLGDEVAKSSDALGIQIGKYQELRYAAKRSGIGNFDSNIQAFTKRLGEAARGTGRAKDALDSLGLSADTLTQMSPDEALAEVADRMKDVTDPSRRASLAADMFSRSGINMVNMLKDGKQGLKEYGVAARATGNVLSEKAARDAEVFQDAMLNAQMGMAGMKNTIGAELMPAITELMDDLSGWMRENRDQVKSFAKEFGTRLKNALPILRDIAVGAASTAKTLGMITSSVAGLVGGFDNLGMILAFLFAMKPVMAILAFGKAIFAAGTAVVGLAGGLPAIAAGIKAIGLALAANPIGIAVMAIAGAATLIYKNWDGISGWFSARWGDIKAAFDGGLAGIGKLIVNWSPFGLFYKAFSKVLSWFGIDLPDTFTGFGKQILDGLVGGLMGGLKKVKDTIVNAGKETIGWFKDVLGIKSPSRVFMGAGKDTLEGYRQGIKKQEPEALKQVSQFGKRVRRVGAGIAIGASTLPAAAGDLQYDSRPPIASAPAAASASAGDTININVYSAPGQNAQEIAAEVNRILQERDRRKATRARSALYDRE